MVTTPSDNDTKAAAYTLVRDSNLYDRIFFMVHRLGLQSNILVSARYVPTESGSGNASRLSRDAVVAALRAVVEAHPALRMIAVIRKSQHDGKHYAKLGMLHTINLSQCVEFVDDESVGIEFFEKVHNTWEWFEEEPSRPWWKVFVVGGRDIVWVSHHVVCDANSGIPFHRTFLQGLNSYAGEQPTFVDPIVTLDPAASPPFPDPLTLAQHKTSILEIIWTNIKRLFISIVLGSRLMFTSLPPPKPYFKSVTEVASPSMRTVTQVSALRISAQKMNRILAACRANGTTFTGLLMVMLLATFSVDLFPNDRVGGSLFAFDVRSRLRMPKLDPVLARDGIMMNGGSGGSLTHWLTNYRNIMSKTKRDGKLVSSVDANAAWKLARWYRRAMTKGMDSKYMRAWVTAKLLPDDLETFVGRILSGIGNATSKSFLCSNLGAFSFQTFEENGDAEQSWTIEDLQFSAACVNGNVGSRGFVFNVVGVKGGDTVIHLSCENGVVSREMAEDSLRLTMDKIDSLLESEDKAVLDRLHVRTKPRTRGFWLR